MISSIWLLPAFLLGAMCGVVKCTVDDFIKLQRDNQMSEEQIKGLGNALNAKD